MSMPSVAGRQAATGPPSRRDRQPSSSVSACALADSTRDAASVTAHGSPPPSTRHRPAKSAASFRIGLSLIWAG